jgi:hypothetical protein
MKLDALKRSRSRRPVYSARVADEDGKEDYELSITGPQKLIETIFEKVDFGVEIAPSVTNEQFEERSRRFWKKRMGQRPASPPSIETVASLLAKKHQAPAPTKDSVIVYLRRTEGEGTFWGLWVPTLTLPPATGLFFFLPRVWTTWSGVVPFTGNPNLFLNIAPPPAALVSSAILGGLTAEAVSFTTAPFPWSHFAAWHSVVNAAPAAYTVTPLCARWTQCCAFLSAPAS